jgi:hypothetical protein
VNTRSKKKKKKTVAFLHANSELAEKESMKTISFIIASKIHSNKFFLLFCYSYVHTTLGSFPPLPPPPPLPPTLPPSSPPTPSIPSRKYFALISNFVEERV